jgi:hypothetical protein
MSKFNRSITPVLVLITLIVSALACNAPQPSRPTEQTIASDATDTPQPTDTPTSGESTPTEATSSPTPIPPTATPVTVGPTDTPMAVCTPPPCTENEVYYCPGECPGGCGTECATPTPTSGTAAPPEIISFTAGRTNIVEGEEVTLSWQATGGTEAVVQWVTHEAVMAYAPGPLDPNGDAVTIKPTGDGVITLIVENDAGADEAEIQLTITCPHPWVEALAEPPPLASACPTEAIYSQAAQQSFENGFMIWMGAVDTIYVFYYPLGNNPAPYETYADRFVEGDQESDPNITPPSGLYQPVRGFGLVWRENDFVRDRIGWATAPERGYQTWMQSYRGMGMHAHYTLLAGIDGTIYHLRATGSVWEVYAR